MHSCTWTPEHPVTTTATRRSPFVAKHFQNSLKLMKIHIFWILHQLCHFFCIVLLFSQLPSGISDTTYGIMVKVYFSPGCNSATHMLCRNGIQTAKKQNGGKFHHPACPYHNNKVDIIFPIIFSVAVIRKRTNKGGRVAFF